MSSFGWSEGTSRYDNAGKWPSPWKELSEPVSTFWQPNQQVERNSGFNFSIANQSSLQQEARFLIKTSGRFFFAFFSLPAAPPRSSGCRRTSRWAVWLFRARVGLWPGKIRLTGLELTISYYIENHVCAAFDYPASSDLQENWARAFWTCIVLAQLWGWALPRSFLALYNSHFGPPLSFFALLVPWAVTVTLAFLPS